MSGLTARELNLIQDAFRVGHYRALYGANVPLSEHPSQEEVNKECDDWLKQGARFGREYSVADHLHDTHPNTTDL